MARACITLILLSLATAVTPVAAAEEGDTVYELRVYTCEPGKLEALHTRFRDHTLRIFEKHGMVNVAYWTPIEAPLSETTLIYVLQHKSFAAAGESWAAFRNDPEWKQVAAASMERDGKILAKSPEATYFTLADFSPAVQALDPSAGFVLRTYTANETKLANLHTRFREHTLELFTKHGMTNLWYFTPQEEPRHSDTLIYFLAHSSREAATESWKNFLADPDWQAAYKASEVGGAILAKRPDALFLKLTDYSPQLKTAE